MQSNDLNFYQLNCVYRELLLHINCNELYLKFSVNILAETSHGQWNNVLDSFETANKNLAHLDALLADVKAQLSLK